jgi:UDP-GlcNAc:undecaprenyl-phosphate GlcNAc-1-phosphate transferase
MNLASDPNLLLAAAALLAGSVLTAAARRIAVRAGVFDQPDGTRKLHRNPTPLMGGAAIYAALLLTIAVAALLPSTAALLATLPAGVLPMLLVSGGLFCGLGLYDDIWPMKPWRKLACQFVAAMPFAVWGQKVSWIEFLGFDLALGALLGAAFTAVWLVACANTINLIDGLDGLAGTVGLIACIGIAAVADLRLFPGVAAIALIAAGSLTGFLCHNLPPARIFLGDSGSLLIGFLIGALSIEASLKTAAGFAMTVPVILVSIPAFDTFMAILRRKLSGRGIGEGDRGHIHHRLQERGLTRTQTLVVIAGLCTAMTLLTVLCVSYQADRLCVLLCISLLGLLIVGRVFGHHETLLFLRRAQRIGQLLINGSTLFGPRPLRAPATWPAAVEQVRPYGITRLELVRFDTRSDAILDHRSWADPSAAPAAWELRVSARIEDRQRLTLIAFGDGRTAAGVELTELFDLLDECCRGWAAVGGPPADPVVAPSVLVRPIPRPKLLPTEPGSEPSRRVA